MITSLTLSMSHLGVDVAPHTPTEFTSLNHSFRISSVEETNQLLGFSLLQIENSIFPLELSFPLTKTISSCFLANVLNPGCLFETCPQIVLLTKRCFSGSTIPFSFIFPDIFPMSLLLIRKE